MQEEFNEIAISVYYKKSGNCFKCLGNVQGWLQLVSIHLRILDEISFICLMLDLHVKCITIAVISELF